MSPDGPSVTVEIEGRPLTLSNLDKALYSDGFTKGQVIEYYVRVAPVMFGHLTGRPLTVKRFPNGTSAPGFIEKNAPRHAPEWIRTVTLPRKGTGWRSSSHSDAETTEFIVVEELATVVWLANLAALEFHTPQWRVANDGTSSLPDLLVFDLDPGPPATIAQCCEVAMQLRERLAADGLQLLAKTSGSKGLQCYASIEPEKWEPDRPSEYAHAIARELEASMGELVVSVMTKSARTGKVFIDWSQNNPAKTTVTPYSLRGRDRPTVSTPVTWDEVDREREGTVGLLELGPIDVLGRIEALGDLFGALAS